MVRTVLKKSPGLTVCLYGAVFSAMLIILMGMGSLGERDDAIPVPDKNYSATFIDQLDIRTECTGVSIDGNTYIKGKRGKGSHTITLDTVSEMKFFKKGSTLTVAVVLRTGATVELTLAGEEKAYGKSSYGLFKISLAELKSMIVKM
ncbi:MAG: hypothetical protein JW884_07985 [Deltaproteobacteria bacterium]|nr:hypothetical protein [Deltaproteobacteria bacterium]